MTAYTLQLGTLLDLLGGVASDGGLYRLNALIDGTEFGDAGATVREVASQLLDGDVVRAGRYENRTAVIRVNVSGTSSLVRAKGAKALADWCNAPDALSWAAQDGASPLTVFRVLRATMATEWDVVKDTKRRQRVYVLTLTCLPFGFSAAPVTDAAQTVGAGADTQVNAADSLNGWTGLNGSTVSLDTAIRAEGTGSIRIAAGTVTHAPYNDEAVQVTYIGEARLTQSVAASTQLPYWSADLYTQDSTDSTGRLWLNEVEATLVSQFPTPGVPGWTRFTWRTNVTAAITTARWSASIRGPWPKSQSNPSQGVPPPTWAPRIDNVRRAGTPPSNTTRESIRRVLVRGTARTQGSLQISGNGSALGDVLVYAHPAVGTGYRPPLMPFYIATGSIDRFADTATMSGFNTVRWGQGTGAGDQPGGRPAIFDIPVAGLPRGTFHLLGYGAGQVGGPPMLLQATVATLINGTQVGPTVSYSKVAGGFSVAAGGVPFFYPASLPVVLPATDVPAGSTAVARVAFKVTQLDGTAYNSASLHELFALAVDDDASLIIATPGTAPRMWIDSASLDQPVPRIYAGTAADRVDSYALGARNHDVLSLVPPGVDLLVANSGAATNPAVTLTHTPAWLQEAVE